MRLTNVAQFKHVSSCGWFISSEGNINLLPVGYQFSVIYVCWITDLLSGTLLGWSAPEVSNFSETHKMS